MTVYKRIKPKLNLYNQGFEGHFARCWVKPGVSASLQDILSLMASGSLSTLQHDVVTIATTAGPGFGVKSESHQGSWVPSTLGSWHAYNFIALITQASSVVWFSFIHFFLKHLTWAYFSSDRGSLEVFLHVTGDGFKNWPKLFSLATLLMS